METNSREEQRGFPNSPPTRNPPITLVVGQANSERTAVDTTQVAVL